MYRSQHMPASSVSGGACRTTSPLAWRSTRSATGTSSQRARWQTTLRRCRQVTPRSWASAASTCRVGPTASHLLPVVHLLAAHTGALYPLVSRTRVPQSRGRDATASPWLHVPLPMVQAWSLPADAVRRLLFVARGVLLCLVPGCQAWPVLRRRAEGAAGAGAGGVRAAGCGAAGRPAVGGGPARGARALPAVHRPHRPAERHANENPPALLLLRTHAPGACPSVTGLQAAQQDACWTRCFAL